MESLPFIDWCLHNLTQYWVIILLMAIESSFIPFPSEIVIVPAAYLAAASAATTVVGAPVSHLSIPLIIVFATVGAVIGAFLNYGLSIWIGRPVVYRFAESRLGHMCLLSKEKVEKAEVYFKKHGAMGTFFGRLVPAVRQLISIPAGLSRMNILKFATYTALGSAIWNTILALIGVYLASLVSYDQLNEKIKEYSVPLMWSMIGLGALVVAYLVWQGLRSKK
ncbi:MAG: DedA family protein [Bacteroidales bacterium]|nr:DedA family protein [Candidatus Physcousia equi]